MYKTNSCTNASGSINQYDRKRAEPNVLSSVLSRVLWLRCLVIFHSGQVPSARIFSSNGVACSPEALAFRSAFADRCAPSRASLPCPVPRAPCSLVSTRPGLFLPCPTVARRRPTWTAMISVWRRYRMRAWRVSKRKRVTARGRSSHERFCNYL